jgi:hypothetical protein
LKQRKPESEARSARRAVSKARNDLEKAVSAAVDHGSIDFCTCREVYYAFRRLQEERARGSVA